MKKMSLILILMLAATTFVGCKALDKDYISKEETVYKIIEPANKEGKENWGNVNKINFINKAVVEGALEEEVTTTYLEAEHPEVLGVQKFLDEMLPVFINSEGYTAEKVFAYITEERFNESKQKFIDFVPTKVASDEKFIKVREIDYMMFSEDFNVCRVQLKADVQLNGKDYIEESIEFLYKENGVWKSRMTDVIQTYETQYAK